MKSILFLKEETEGEHPGASGAALFYPLEKWTQSYFLRRRQKVTTLVQVVLPTLFLLLLVLLQLAIPPSEFKNCQFRLGKSLDIVFNQKVVNGKIVLAKF